MLLHQRLLEGRILGIILIIMIKYLFTACWFFDFLDAEGKVLSQCDIHLCIKFCVLIDNMKSWSAFYKARS